MAAIATGPRGRQRTRAPGALGPLHPRVQPSCCGAPGRTLMRLPPPRTQPAPSGTDGPGWDASLGRGRQPDGLQLTRLRQLGSRGRRSSPPPPAPNSRQGGVRLRLLGFLCHLTHREVPPASLSTRLDPQGLPQMGSVGLPVAKSL